VLVHFDLDFVIPLESLPQLIVYELPVDPFVLDVLRCVPEELVSAHRVLIHPVGSHLLEVKELSFVFFALLGQLLALVEEPREILHDLLHGDDGLLVVLSGFMILPILVLNVCDVIIADTQRLEILRLLENAGGLCEVHDGLGVALQKEIVDLEAPCVQQLLEQLLQLLHLGRSIFDGIFLGICGCLLVALLVDIDIGILELHVPEAPQQELQGPENKCAHLGGDPVRDEDHGQECQGEDYHLGQRLALDDTDFKHLLGEFVHIDAEEDEHRLIVALVQTDRSLSIELLRSILEKHACSNIQVRDFSRNLLQERLDLLSGWVFRECGFPLLRKDVLGKAIFFPRVISNGMPDHIKLLVN
jgi:hypothetical protein